MKNWKRKATRAVLVLAIVGSGVGVVGGGAVHAANTITVYFDINNNGTQDPGEPGVPGIRVNSGRVSNGVTDADGKATLDGLNDPGRARISTGWYASNCAELYCAANANGGTDNDFRVVNQIILLAGGTADADYSMGIVPDWPGGYSAMPKSFAWNDDGDGVLEAGEATSAASNAVDVATRISWPTPSTPGNCFRTDTVADRACEPGDSPYFDLQVFNEGTEDLTGIQGVLDLPFPVAISARNIAAPLNTQDVDIALGRYDPVTGSVPFSLTGTLPPAAAGQYAIEVPIPTDARSSVTLGEGYMVSVRIVGVDQWDGTNDPDSEQCDGFTGAVCSPAIGVHDKQDSPSDDSDSAGFSVINGAAPDSVYDLALATTVATVGPYEAGDEVTYTIEIFNQGTANVRNVHIADYVPSGMVFDAADNPRWAADATTVFASQLASGQSTSVDLVLAAAASGDSAQPGTASTRNFAEITDFFDSETGTVTPVDVDSTPDDDPTNDGYDNLDPFDQTGNGVIDNNGSTTGTSAGGEDDQDPAGIILQPPTETTTTEPSPPITPVVTIQNDDQPKPASGVVERLGIEGILLLCGAVIVLLLRFRRRA